MVKRTHQTIWVVFALFLVYLLLVRLVITWAQLAPNHFGETVAWITESDVTFETLTIKQNWLGVEVEVKEALIEHDGFEVEASRITFDFNLFSPLVPNASWGDYLTIENLAVLEYGLPSQDAQSDTSVDSLLSLNSQELTTKVDISRLWKQVEVNDFSATFFQKKVAWKVNVDSFQAFKGARWTLAADFNLHYGQVLQGERFQLKASLMPNVFGGVEHGDFTIKAYDPISLKRLAQLTPLKWQNVLPDGELVPNVKGSISKSLLSNLSVELSAPGLIWPNLDKSLPKSLGVNLEWQNQAKIYDGSQTNWQFLLSSIQLNDQFIQTVSPVSVQLVSKRFLHIEANEFDIKPFKPIIKAISLNENVSQLFDVSAELLLKDLVADLAVPQLYFENISANVATLAIPVTNLPGIALQDLQINKVGSEFKLHSEQPIWVMYPLIHPVPMRFELMSELNGALDVPNDMWKLSPLNIEWDGMPLTFSGTGDFRGGVDVKSQIEPGTIANVKQYLPYSIMTTKLQNWLKVALVSGKEVKGQLYFKGDLNNYPFKKGATRFGGTVNFKDGDFKFHKDWPEIKKLDATIEWSQFDLSILADNVLLGKGINAKEVNVTVGSLNTKNIAVEFSAKAQAEGSVAIDYLLASPLPNLIGLEEFLQNKTKLNLTGPVDVRLSKVWLPVYGFAGKHQEVEGSVRLDNAQLTLFDKLIFDDLTGLLTFDDKSLQSKGLTSLFEGGASKFEVNTRKEQIQIKGTGQATLDYPSIVKGQMDYAADISIPIKKKQQQTLIDLSMDTSKLSWSMPAPLNNSSLQGALNTTISIAKNEIHVEGSVSELGGFDLYLDSSKENVAIKKGVINFGEGSTQLINKSGLKVSGLLPLVDLDHWARWTWPEVSGGDEGSFLKNIDWNSSNLHVDEVKFIDYLYKDVKMNWNNAINDGFNAQLLSKQISTSLDVKASGELDVTMDWLQIFLPINSMESGLTTSQRQELVGACKTKPITNHIWPALRFTGKNIKVDEIGVPTLSFKVEDNANKLRFKEIEATLENGSGTLLGDYDFYKDSRISSTNLNLKSSNVKNLTQLLGLKKGFTGTKASVKSNIVWQGGLECFNLLGLLGKTEYQLKEGVIEDVEPGFARLLGLLNVTSLARRLSLDLKDITTKGFAYDTIKGETHFINGRLNLKDFELKSPSASVGLKGDVDLIDRSFNLKANVIPALGSSLPALSALTGVATPLGALAVYALMKVIPELNEELVTYKYSITGPWNEPIIDGGNRPAESTESDLVDDILQID